MNGDWIYGSPICKIPKASAVAYMVNALYGIYFLHSVLAS